MTILNAPSRETCVARRERTNTPLQALLLLNEREYLKAARHLAKQSLADGTLGDAERLEQLYDAVTSQLPDEEETQTLLQLSRDLDTMYTENPQLADKVCAGVELREGTSRAELAAWTLVVSSLFNLDITKSRQ